MERKTIENFTEDMIGKRVELLTEDCWVAAVTSSNKGGWVAAGSTGVVKKTAIENKLGGIRSIVHIDFDNVKPKSGYYFGVGAGSIKNFKVLD